MRGRDTASPGAAGREAAVRGVLGEIFGRLLGVPPGELPPAEDFVRLGADSLALLQASQAIKGRLGVKVPFRRMLEDHRTLASLSRYVADQDLPAGFLAAAAEPPAVEAGPPAAAALPAAGGGGDATPLERLIFGQLALMAEQLRRFQKDGAEPVAPAAPAAPAASAAPSLSPPAPQAFGPFRPAATGGGEAGEVKIRRYLEEELIPRFTRRTAGSKAMTQERRAVLADNRVAAGFRRRSKELTYPVHAERSRGSRIWDVDGNEFIDLLMGFGVDLFGHSPPFLRRAMAEQLEKGVQIGPQSPLAGEVAERIRRLTGVERVCFCNTGTEACMTALRVARTVTGRETVAIFEGAYHGTSDGVLGRRTPSGAPVPAAPGVPATAVAELLVLPWAEEAALEELEARGREIAAVMVEPVQSRRPSLQPRSFLHRLRKLTRRTGSALIFDEMITGFRLHPGGAQAWFDVEADLVTYGKILGGGLPIGILAGRRELMDAIDGGFWSFGDDSYPQELQTFYAGTFSKHPLALAAARAVLERLEEEGPGLQEELGRRTAELAVRLGEVFAAAGVPLEVSHCSSFFRFDYPARLEAADLFFHELLDRGVFVAEGRGGFLSTAHTDDDLREVVAAAAAGLRALQGAGLLVVAAPAGGEVPLTDGQQQLWTAAQIGEGASVAYNETLTLDLRGALDADALEGALAAVVQRHESLRASFARDGRGLRIAPAVEVELERWDLGDLGDGEGRETLDARLEAFAHRPFDLEAPPLIRFALARLGREHHLLALTAHHVAADGWSVGILLEEIAWFYSREGGELPEPVPLREYAELEARRASSAEGEADRAYWREKFPRGVPVLELPTDRPRPAVKGFAGERRERGFAAAPVRALAAELGTTFFTALIGAWTVLMHRLSGQREVVLGFPVAGQAQLEGRVLVGHCVNLLPLLSSLAGSASWRTYLGAMAREVLDTQEHQSVPFGALVELLGVEAAASRPPLVAVSFNVDRRGTVGGFAGLEVELATRPSRGAKFDLVVNGVDAGSELLIECDFDTALFDATTVSRWLCCFGELLGDLVANPEAPPLRAPLLGPAGRHQMLLEWNDTAVAYPRDAPVHRLFQEVAASRPEAVALKSAGEVVRYGELDRRADHLAETLGRVGVALGQPVAVFLERSPELVVTLLAVLKAGGAYVPLDPGYPRDRLAAMLEDSGAVALVTSRALEERLPPADLPRLLVDAPEEGREAPAGPPPAPPPSGAEDPAYILFTSGSQGRPKGVCVSHRAVVRLVRGSRFARLDGSVTLLQMAPVSFDAATFEIWGALLNGGRLVLAPPERPSPRRIAEILRRHRVDTLWLTAGLFHEVVDQGGEGLGSVTQLLAGGDVLSTARTARLLAEHPRCRLVNGYGPTEATTFACCHDVASAPATAHGSVPIGRPIANARVYALSPGFEPVPPAVAGELSIGGDGLALGYWGDPRLTAESFVPDPWGRGPGERLYRTGDLVRWLPEGYLEFLGRIDEQVKISGYRVEPGEVERALEAHPSVAEAAVKALRRGLDRSLVAYVIPTAGKELAEGELRRHLEDRLPEYSIPAAFVELAAFPLGPNGKVDRRRLPPPPDERPRTAVPFQAPESPAQRSLAEIWSEVLGVARIGVDDDFFELGGTSLRAARATARIRRTFAVEVPMRSFYEQPTIRRLAAEVEERLLAVVDEMSEEEVQSLLQEQP